MGLLCDECKEYLENPFVYLSLGRQEGDGIQHIANSNVCYEHLNGVPPKDLRGPTAPADGLVLILWEAIGEPQANGRLDSSKKPTLVKQLGRMAEDIADRYFPGALHLCKISSRNPL